MSPVDHPPISLWVRSLANDVETAPQTFSSWDSCMAKSYCKWPVIVGIIIGAVILLSVIACVVNCLCCGIQCCTGCCACLSCCCPSPRNKGPNRTKYMDDPVYHQPPPMPASMPSHNVYQSSPSPPVYRGAQIARFDTPGPPRAKMNEDALPAMPSWDEAVTRRVEDPHHEEAMEMEPLNPSHQEPHRMPPPVRPIVGQPGVPPIRTGNASNYYPENRAYDDPHARRSPGPLSPPPRSPGPNSQYDQYNHQDHAYDQPYRDNYNGSPLHASSPTHAPYNSQQHYMPMPSPSAEMPRPIPYRKPTPGLPGFPQPPAYRGISPIPTPPPPFSATNPVPLEVSDPGRPPSILQSGRKPAPNSYRDV